MCIYKQKKRKNHLVLTSTMDDAFAFRKQQYKQKRFVGNMLSKINKDAQSRHALRAENAARRRRGIGFGTGTGVDVDVETEIDDEFVMSPATLQRDVDTIATCMNATPPRMGDIRVLFQKWLRGWQAIQDATCALADGHQNDNDDDDNDDNAYDLSSIDADVLYARTAFLNIIDGVIIPTLTLFAVDVTVLHAALYLLRVVLADVSLNTTNTKTTLLPFLLFVLRGADTGADEACVVESAYCFTAVMSAAAVWDNEEAVAVCVHASRRITDGTSTQYAAAMTALLSETIRECSTARLATVMPVLFGIVQLEGAADSVRADAMAALASLTPMDEAAFAMLRSCGVLSYCISHINAVDMHVLLLQRMLQFIGCFTDEHTTTAQWATELGVLNALTTLCFDPSTLPSGVAKEVLWILADLSCSTAIIRALLLADERLCVLPAALILHASTRSKNDSLRTAAASVLVIFFENADERFIQHMLSLHVPVMDAFIHALVDGISSEGALNLLVTLEDIFQLNPSSLTDFVHYNGIAALQRVQALYRGHAVARRAFEIAETYALTD